MADQELPIEKATTDGRLLRFYRYWKERCGTSAFPARRDIDPIDFTFALGRVSIIEVQRAPIRFVYRLVSTELTEHLGYEMSGKSVEEIPNPAMRLFARGFYERALAHAAPLHETGNVLIDRYEWWYEALALPLASDGASIDMLLVYRNTSAPILATPPYRSV